MKIFTILFSLITFYSIKFVYAWEHADHSPDCELVLTQVVFRHGDRNPITFYPNDPYKNESFWPEGFGQLTRLGKQQQYLLGKYLKDRYSGYLSDQYSPYEIRVQSSDVDRTIMSAEVNLEGLYPPSANFSIWNENVKWQPIPVHNRPETEDNMIAMKAPCSRYDYLFDNFLLNSDIMKKINSENQKLYQLLSNYSGSNITNPKDVDYLMDDLIIERWHNYTLPNWTQNIFPEHEAKIKELTAFSFKMMSFTPEMRRLKGGPLLKELLNNMKLKMNGTIDSRRKIFMFSGHDTTVGTLLNTLNLFNDISPPYRSMVIIELHRNISNNQYFIEVYYRNTTEAPAYKLEIPGCDASCNIEKFIELTKPVIPEDWKHECQASHFSYDFVGIIVAGMLGIILTGLVAFLGIMLKSYFKNRRSGGTGSPPKYPYLHLQMEDGEEEA